MMTARSPLAAATPHRGVAAGIFAVSAALLMTELALTRIFSVTMFYHFAFLAISIALFGLSASSVGVYVARRRLERYDTRWLLAVLALLHAIATLVALFALVRLRAGLNYSAENLARMLAIYGFASLPFLTGGAVVAVAFSRMTARINLLYGADLLGAAAGCVALIPLLNYLGAPGGVFTAAVLSSSAAIVFAPVTGRRRVVLVALVVLAVPAAAQVAGFAPFDVARTKGHDDDRVLFSKWNSFSRVAVYDRAHGDWSLSATYTGKPTESLFMDIDSAASTPILKNGTSPDAARYLRSELTALAYHLVEPRGGFSTLVIGPGGGRDLASALNFGAAQVDAVEINPIIARDVMLGRFREYSGNIYGDPRVSITVADGRNFVRRSNRRYDVIQASLVDTWAATAAGAYTLTENSLYTTEAFADYLDHLSDDGLLTITRWVFDGLRLVSLAQEACAARGLDAARHLAVIRHDRVATFLLKRSPFTPDEVSRLHDIVRRLGFTVLYLPGVPADPVTQEDADMQRTGTSAADYEKFILAPDRHRFIAGYPRDIRPTTDNRPFFFHTTRLGDQFDVAFGRSMLFGNGLSALLTLFGISLVLVIVFIVLPLAVSGTRPGSGWPGWLAYFAALGTGFMLIEVALLQHFVLLLGHPVYSLTVTLFSLLLGTGIGSLAGRRVSDGRVHTITRRALLIIAIVALAAPAILPGLIDLGIPWPLPLRIVAATVVLMPLGALLGMALPGGMRLLARVQPDLVPWGWGMNGAFSVVGATLAIFIAMNWGFAVTLIAGAVVYLMASVTFSLLPRPS
jgi:predicted membrane-bound spermidine synthase